MKNKSVLHSSPINTKPIHESKLTEVQGSNPNKTHESIVNKFKHGLSEAGNFVKDHTIGEVEKAGKAIQNKATDVVHSVEHSISTGAHFASTQIKAGASDLLAGAKQVESGLLPSSSNIIMESGLAVVGLGIVAVLVVKFL